MHELMQIGTGAVAGTIASIVVLLPRKWLPATILAGLFVPLLVICAAMIVPRIAFGGLSGEPGNPVSELDLWLAGVAFFDIVAAMLCLGRVLAWVKDTAGARLLHGHGP